MLQGCRVFSGKWGSGRGSRRSDGGGRRRKRRGSTGVWRRCVERIPPPPDHSLPDSTSRVGDQPSRGQRVLGFALLAGALAIGTMAHAQEAYDVVTVPLVLAPGSPHGQSLVRIVNQDNLGGTVRITATDDGGNTYDPFTIYVDGFSAAHFHSDDLANGNPAKGIRRGIGPPRQGNWRLQVETNTTSTRVLHYVRTPDGFLTAVGHVSYLTSSYFTGRSSGSLGGIFFFNPASNVERQSRLRLINWGDDDETVEIVAWDDAGSYRRSVSLTLVAGHARTLTAIDLENGTYGVEGALGDGTGKWRLYVIVNSNKVVAQNLLYASSGHISDLTDWGVWMGLDTNDDSNANAIDDMDVTVPAQCRTAVEVCVRDYSCEDGDRVKVTVNGLTVFEGELFNEWACRTVDVHEGRNRIVLEALNGTGFKGNCAHPDVNTGELRVTGQGGRRSQQRWRHRGGKGSIANLNITVGPRNNAACDYN